jgi:hypothetical protein
VRHLTFYGQLGKFSWRMLATVLAGESVIVFFGALVARAMASAGGDARGGTWLATGSALAVLCLVAAGTMRRPWGVTLGWAVQALTLLSALVVPAMLLVGLLFLALWVLCMVQGRRVDELQAQRAAQGEPVQGEPGQGPAGPATPPPSVG